MNVVSQSANAMTMTLTMNRMVQLWQTVATGRRGTVENVTATEQPGVSVRLRPEIAALPPYRQGRPAPADGFKLSSNENPFDPLPAAARLSPPPLTRSTGTPMPTALAVRERLAARFGVTADEVIVGAGSVALLAQFITAAAAPGDEVVYSWRSFEAYPGSSPSQAPRASGCRTCPTTGTTSTRWRRAITDRTRVVIVCSPNNPTGTIVTAAEFERFMARVPADLLVLLDEAYIEFVRDRRHRRRPHADRPLPEPRASCAPSRRPTASPASAWATRSGRSRSSTPPARRRSRSASPAPRQAGAIASLDAEAELLERVDVIAERRDRLRAALVAQGWPVPEAQGNFVWLPTGADTVAVAERLFDAGVVTRAFPPDGIRISVGEEESVDTLLRILGELVPGSQERAAD